MCCAECSVRYKSEKKKAAMHQASKFPLISDEVSELYRRKKNFFYIIVVKIAEAMIDQIDLSVKRHAAKFSFL